MERTRGQVRLLRAALEAARRAGVRPRWVHAGNSLTAWGDGVLGELRRLAREMDAELLVRPGLGLYGIAPEARADACLEPVMRWRTEVLGVREVCAGTPVGYGGTFRAPAGGARLALLPVGYADGLRRELGNRGCVLVRGHRAPIAGRVSMDQTVVDVSGVPGVARGGRGGAAGAAGGRGDRGLGDGGVVWGDCV